MEINTQTLNNLYNETCKKCPWQHPDTCRVCEAKNRVIVLSVNKSGIKGG